MDVLLALILSCSVHFDDHLVEALAAKLSLDNPYFVGDLSTLNTYDTAHSVAEAHQLVEEIFARGGRPAVGYLAVPTVWAARFGRAPDDLFDGCVNVGVATSMLSEYAHACARKGDHHRQFRRRARGSFRATAPALRPCILRRLEIDLNMAGIVEHVLPDAAHRDAGSSNSDEDSPPARAPLYPDNTDSSGLHEPADWSSPRLYFFSSPAGQAVTATPAPATGSPISVQRNSRSLRRCLSDR